MSNRPHFFCAKHTKKHTNQNFDTQFFCVFFSPEFFFLLLFGPTFYTIFFLIYQISFSFFILVLLLITVSSFFIYFFSFMCICCRYHFPIALHYHIHNQYLLFLFSPRFSLWVLFFLFVISNSFFIYVCTFLHYMFFMFGIFSVWKSKKKKKLQINIHFIHLSNTRIIRSSRLYPSGVLIISIEDWCQFTQRQQQQLPHNHNHHHNHHRQWHDTHSTQIIRIIMQCYRHRFFRANRSTQRHRYPYRRALHAVPFQIKHHPDCKSSTTSSPTTGYPCSSDSYSSSVFTAIQTNAFYYYAFVVVFSVVYTTISIFK